MDSKPPLPEPPAPISIEVQMVDPSEVVKVRQGSRDAKIEEAAAKDVPKPAEAKAEPPKPRPTPPPPAAAAEPPPPPEPEPKQVAAATPPPAPAPQEAPRIEEKDQAALDRELEKLALEKAIEDDKRQQDAAARAKAKSEADAKARAEAEAKAKADADAKAKADAEAKKKADEKKKRDLAEAKRKAEEKRKADLTKQKLDTDKLSALLNKVPDPKEAPAAAPAPKSPTKQVGPVKGDRDGRDDANAGATLIGMIVGKIERQGCWNIQAGGELASNQVPKIEFELNADGTVRGQPRVLNQQGSPQFVLASDAAKSAILKCQPYALPADKYHLWRKVTLDFDPKEMFR